MPFELGYVSTAAGAFGREALAEILTTARTLNGKNGVTGLFLYYGGHFLQVLEGTEDAVRETFARIREDARHHDIAVLFEETINASLYPDWSMGFQMLDGSELLEFPAVDGKPKDLRAMTGDIGRAKQLLLHMRRSGLDPDKGLATSA